MSDEIADLLQQDLNDLITQVRSVNLYQFSQMLDYHSLSFLFTYVHTQNKGIFNPYHDTSHLFEVARTACELYRAEVRHMDRAGGLVPSCFERDTSEKALILAGLFHDFNHSGGALKDSENIALACKALDVVADEILRLTRLGDKFIDYVKHLIRITEYPFIYVPETLEEKCLRDADLLGFIEPEGHKRVMGLRAERNQYLLKDHPYGPMEAYQHQVEFVKKTVFYTRTARDLWGAAAGLSLSRLERLAQYMQNSDLSTKGE